MGALFVLVALERSRGHKMGPNRSGLHDFRGKLFSKLGMPRSPCQSFTHRTEHRFPLNDLDLSRSDRFYDVHDLAYVAGWEPHRLHGLGRDA